MTISPIVAVVSALSLIGPLSSAEFGPRKLSPSRTLLQSCSTTNFCQGKAGGTYANPCSSTSFIQCSNGATFVTQCPGGLVWDTGCSCCNYPKPGSGPSSPAPASPASPGPKSPSPSPKAPSPPAPTAPSASGKVKSAYWGQGAASSTLASICGRYDLIFLSFLPNFGKGQDVTSTSAINIAGHSLTQTAADIRTCQGQGKKIILSLGGGVGNYGFSNTADAQSTAQSIWNAYLGGSGTNRPFGSIVLDGIDLDVEAPAGKQYYADFVKALKGLYKTGSRTFFLTAVPQCPFPDANLGPSLGTALGDTASSFDYVSIQFYNNPSCGGPNTVSGYLPWNS
ncbi:hypothetical protein WJX84_009830, partial [Apatococcus fuscideae]